jgi:hypothetical protein
MRTERQVLEYVYSNVWSSGPHMTLSYTPLDHGSQTVSPNNATRRMTKLGVSSTNPRRLPLYLE